MYSMVLMMALNGGAVAPADHHGCAGCQGAVVAHGCDGCRGGGFLGGHKLFNRGCRGDGCNGCNGGHRLFSHHGCRGGCNGCNGGHRMFSHGCRGDGCNGCGGGFLGGLFRHHRSHGCNGGCAGYACNGGCGGVVAPAMPAKPAETIPAKPKEAPKPQGTLIVDLPALATLSVDDQPTTSTGESRVFSTPDLEDGKTYVYTLKAEIVRDGKTVTTTKQVTVRAGEETRTTIEFPVATTAAK